MEREKIILTADEVRVLKGCFDQTFNPMDAPAEDVDIQLALIDKAEAYEEKYNLVDERFDYTDNCDLLSWFYHVYATQEGIEHSLPVFDDGIRAMTEQ